MHATLEPATRRLDKHNEPAGSQDLTSGGGVASHLSLRCPRRWAERTEAGFGELWSHLCRRPVHHFCWIVLPWMACWVRDAPVRASWHTAPKWWVRPSAADWDAGAFDMRYQALLILLIPALGLISILQARSWRVTSSTLFNVLFWIGWLVGLIVGIVMLIA